MENDEPEKIKTIIKDSNLGKRLEKIKKSETMYIKSGGEHIPIASTINIGRDKTNEVYIDDKMVSRKHAMIQKIKNAYFIKDLGSTNGTYVNEKQIPEAKYIRLQINDVIRIGRTELVIRQFIE